MRYSLRLISSRSSDTIERHLAKAGVDPEGIAIIKNKSERFIIKVDNVKAAAANIIKQQLLSIGGDAAVHRDVITGKPPLSTVYILTDRRRIEALAEKLEHQPFALSELGRDIIRLVEDHESPPQHIPLPGGGTIDLSDGPIVMGVLNVTPDSFSDGGSYNDPEQAVDRAHQMVEEGAGIIDIGGESSRPGAGELPAEDELARIQPVLERLSGRLGVPVSIDTRKAEVARTALDLGAVIINDISGFTRDPGMIPLAAKSGAAVVVMHMKGTPKTMQDDPSYDDVVSEILQWIEERTGILISNGVSPDKIIVDPGIGFGKRLADNIEILQELGDFRSLGFPVLVGHSRKSFIGMITGREPDERLWGGLAALAKCLDGGARILRVHDVKETIDFIKVWRSIELKGNVV
jgi:dihydropteroate synthase